MNDTMMIKERRHNRERTSSHSAYTTCTGSTIGLIGGGVPQPARSIDKLPESAMVVKTQKQSLQYNGLYKRHKQHMIDGSINHEDLSRKKGGTCSSTVNFSHATVRLHSMILGDNPACTDGPPITISWHHNKEFTYAIPHYEAECQNDMRKVPNDLQLNSEERINILQNRGFSYGEIQRCTLKTNYARAERLETIKRLQQHHILIRFKNFLAPKQKKNKSMK